jgi:hypothetical protein
VHSFKAHQPYSQIQRTQTCPCDVDALQATALHPYCAQPDHVCVMWMHDFLNINFNIILNFDLCLPGPLLPYLPHYNVCVMWMHDFLNINFNIILNFDLCLPGPLLPYFPHYKC